jgi:hypothetical protein
MRFAPIILKLCFLLEGSLTGNIVINAIVKSFKNALCAYYSQIGHPRIYTFVSPSELHEDQKIVSKCSLSSRGNTLLKLGLGITPHSGQPINSVPRKQSLAAGSLPALCHLSRASGV